MMHVYMVYHCVSRYAIIILYNICSIEYQQFTCYYVIFIYIYTLEHMYLLSNRNLHTRCAGIARIAGMLQVISWNCCLDLNETTWHRWVEFSRQVCQVWKSEEYTVFHRGIDRTYLRIITCVAEWISLPFHSGWISMNWILDMPGNTHLPCPQLVDLERPMGLARSCELSMKIDNTSWGWIRWESWGFGSDFHLPSERTSMAFQNLFGRPSSSDTFET